MTDDKKQEKAGEKPHGSTQTLSELSKEKQEKLNRHDPGNAGLTGLSPELRGALNFAVAEENMDAAANPVPGMMPGQDMQKAANIAGWKTAVMQVVPMVCAVIPEFKELIAKAQWEELGQALGEAAHHYGLGVGEAFNHPLVKLGIAGFPIVMAGAQVKKIRQIQAGQDKPAPSLTASQEPAIPAMQTPGSVTSTDPRVTVRVMDESQTV